ncbi:hypothetical protein ACE6H2_003050 [Prunus campanulata]
MVASVPELIVTDFSLLTFSSLPADDETKKHELINELNLVEPLLSFFLSLTILLVEYSTCNMYQMNRSRIR